MISNASLRAFTVVDPFTPAEEKAIIKAAESHPQWQNLFRFWLHSGLRTSELIALKWDDVDWINHKVSVVEALVSGIRKSTKTRAGKRMIELDGEAMYALHQQKEHTFLHSDYIFHDPRLNTHWQTSDSVRKKPWQPTLKKAGVRYRRPYNCRHTFACRYISSGANFWWLANKWGTLHQKCCLGIMGVTCGSMIAPRNKAIKSTAD